MKRGLIGLCALLLGASPAPVADVLIRGGTIFTGAEMPGFVGDVAITGDRISYVGPSRGGSARQVIDARGRIVAPGFIDAHTHPDSFIRSPDPAVRVNAAWLAQGVSTIVTGVDGYGTPDIAADAARLTTAGVGTNVVPFIGFGAVRGRVLGQAGRSPTAAELASMRALVAKGMCEGAYGLSTGLFYAPQSFATTDEVIAVAREAGSRGGLYDTHQRDESSYSIGVLASVAEVGRIGREARMPVHIAHLKALGVDVQGQARQIIRVIERARAAGIDVTADQYPWLASGSALDAALLPRWASDGGFPPLAKRFADPVVKAKLRAEMIENLRRRGGADAILMTAAGMPWTGRTLAALAAEWRVEPVDAAIRMIVPADGTPPRGIAIASFNMVDADVDRIMRQPWVVTGSDGSDGHPRQFATFPMKYQRYVRERKVIDLARFIRNSTGRTADIYRLDRRGYLKVGYFADVVVFDPERFAPQATYVAPTRLSRGVDAVIVNGQPALRDGTATGGLAGRVLLRSQPAACR
ncbi:MAG: amidohydrolase family protein [Pseudomonadota bacterium]